MKSCTFLLCLLLSLSPVLFAQSVCFNEVDTAFPLEPYQAAVLDANNDGHLDLAFIESGPWDVYVAAALGGGDGSLLGSYRHVLGRSNGLQGTAIAVGDFNNDGNQDLVVALSKSGVGILLGNGNGTFVALPQTRTPYNVSSLVAGDFNRDGKLDAAIFTGPAQTAPHEIEVLLGNGDGTLQAPIKVASVPIYGGALLATDLNADGKLDLVALLGDGLEIGSLAVLIGNGDGRFQSPKIYSGATNYNGLSLAVADLNEDGNLDVAITGDGATFSIFWGTGTGALLGPTTISVGSRFSLYSLTTLDLLGNGLQDVVAATYDYFTVIALNAGGGTFSTQRYSLNHLSYRVYSGDFNSDGKPDLVFLFPNNPGVGILLNCS